MNIKKIIIGLTLLLLLGSGVVVAGYSGYHESRKTGEVACGGKYSGYHESRKSGKVCAG